MTSMPKRRMTSMPKRQPRLHGAVDFRAVRTPRMRCGSVALLWCRGCEAAKRHRREGR
jgi:hypothetical protein